MVYGYDRHRQHLQGLSWVPHYVQGTYFHNSSFHIFTIRNFRAAISPHRRGDHPEVPNPMFPQLFAHPVIASFSCTTLEENMATPTETDWVQVYTLMLKRLVKDLHDSHNRLKNALELNRIQDHILKMLDILRKIG